MVERAYNLREGAGNRGGLPPQASFAKGGTIYPTNQK